MIRKPLAALVALLAAIATSHAAERPNILWITSEDNGPELGCYGDAYATTPNIDALAATGTIFLNCWSNAPVCAPARTTLLGGFFPAAAGAQHMRSQAPFPAGLKTYPEHLRAAGYYCINPGKTDYNFDGVAQVWDKTIPVARLAEKAQAGTPFMAVYNYTTSHESQIRKRPHKAVHDPAQAPVPPYHPDTPEVRQDWAQYYDKVSQMDGQVGQKLDEFRKAGLLDSTIVFYYGDHGSGMPRSKRWPYSSGLRVPLVISVPEKFKHLAPEDMQGRGGKTDRLVSFVDFAPTLLSLAGNEPPASMHGVAFMGAHAKPEQPYIYGFRGRMDERHDCVRTVRDQRWQYIRNLNPHRIYGQFIDYMFQTPTTRVWHDLYHAGKLNPAQSAFWEPKAGEELYDLESDPHQVNNLAADPKHAATLDKLRAALTEHTLNIRDLGLLPEGEIHDRAGDRTPYQLAHDTTNFDLPAIHDVAVKATSKDPAHNAALVAALGSGDSAVRYWAATGFLVRGKLDDASAAALRNALEDPSPYVRIAAAETLGRYGTGTDVAPALQTLIAESNVDEVGIYRSMAALNAIDYLDDKAAPALDKIKALPKKSPGVPRRMGAYIPNLVGRITSELAD